MPKFNYVALDARGQESVGVLEAPSSNEVISHLRTAGYFPTSVIEEGKASAARAAKKKSPKAVATRSSAPATKGKGIVLFQKKTIKPKVLMIFTRQLATLIDAHEAHHHPMDPPDPVDAIKFRMEQQGMTRKDLEGIIGTRTRVAEVLNRKRGLSIGMIRRLHDRLGISAEVLIRPSQNSVA